MRGFYAEIARVSHCKEHRKNSLSFADYDEFIYDGYREATRDIHRALDMLVVGLARFHYVNVAI